MNNKMILAAGISLLSMNVLNGEITGEHTMWSGTHLNYDGVSIINKPALPQKGVEAKKGVKNAYNIMPGKVTVITSLNKNPQEKQEWLYKKIHEVRISMTGNIYVALIFADTKNDVVTAQDSCDMRDRLLRYFATCGQEKPLSGSLKRGEKNA